MASEELVHQVAKMLWQEFAREGTYEEDRHGDRPAYHATARRLIETVLGDWQPIETAPKDPDEESDAIGAEFLLLLHDPDNKIEDRVQVGFWNSTTKDWQTIYEHTELKRPTHWMRLPEPPK